MSIYEKCIPVSEDADTVALLLKLHLNIGEITARLLINRGITCLDEARAFLEPSLDQLHDPSALAGMDAAVSRIRLAVERGEKIVVYGDYDADGITSSTALSLYLRSIGAHADVYVPSRLDEGYGLHMSALKSIEESGTSLVITVDCGITAIEEVKSVQGMDIIITDHHTPGVELPKAYAVINPKIPGQTYPYKELAGVGVTAKLIQALGGHEVLLPYLDLIAIGTIADIVPLTGENRVFAALGLRLINSRPRPGVKALADTLGIDGMIDSIKVSYMIAPCLNAPGRMSTFHKGYELLTAEDSSTAGQIAGELAGQNNLRRETENRILEEVRSGIRQQVNLAEDRIIVVEGEGWHPGVVGIVASKITEQYNRPSVIISTDGVTGTGSARSIKGFDLYKALSTCRDLFEKFGGHEQAAGLSLPQSNIAAFRKRICGYAKESIPDEALIPHFIYDAQLTSEDITPGLLREMDMLAPFGFGNPTPRFLLPSASVQSSRLIGKDSKHLKLSLGLGQRSWDAVGFGMAEADKELQQGCNVCVLTSLKLNEWMGVKSTQLQIHSMKRVYCSRADIDELLSMYHFKFFNVFFSEFMYNGIVAKQKNTNDNIVFDSMDAGRLMEHLKSSMVGTALLVNTEASARCVLNHLMDCGMLDRVAVRYQVPGIGDGIGRNTVILAPDYRNIPWDCFHTIVIPEAEHILLNDDCRSMVHRGSAKHNVVLLDKLRSVPDISGEYDISRDQCASVYRWLRSLMPGRDYWPDAGRLLASFRDSTGGSLNGFQLMLALEIFRELGFIVMDTGNQYIRVQCCRNPVSRQLDESRLYVFHRDWISGINALKSDQAVI